jgi:hypothetical protein
LDIGREVEHAAKIALLSAAIANNNPLEAQPLTITSQQAKL